MGRSLALSALSGGLPGVLADVADMAGADAALALAGNSSGDLFGKGGF